FDVNDSDELPALFEWDLKRLAASFAIGGGASGREGPAARPHRNKELSPALGTAALLSPFAAWSSRIDLAGALAHIDTPKIRRALEKRRAVVLRGPQSVTVPSSRRTATGRSGKSRHWCTI